MIIKHSGRSIISRPMVYKHICNTYIIYFDSLKVLLISNMLTLFIEYYHAVPT